MSFEDFIIGIDYGEWYIHSYGKSSGSFKMGKCSEMNNICPEVIPFTVPEILDYIGRKMPEKFAEIKRLYPEECI